MEAQCKRFEVRASEDGRVLFSADEDEITIGAEKLKVTGTVMEIFQCCFPNKSVQNSIEIPLRNFWLPSQKPSCQSYNIFTFQITTNKVINCGWRTETEY